MKVKEKSNRVRSLCSLRATCTAYVVDCMRKGHLFFFCSQCRKYTITNQSKRQRKVIAVEYQTNGNK